MSKERVLQVKGSTVKSQGVPTNCFGITDGKKWFFYAYLTKAEAEGVMAKITPDKVSVNIAHPAPLVIVK